MNECIRRRDAAVCKITLDTYSDAPELPQLRSNNVCWIYIWGCSGARRPTGHICSKPTGRVLDVVATSGAAIQVA